VVETVFNLPGLGSYAVTSLTHADLYALLDLSLVVGVGVSVLNLVADLLYAAIDPRVRIV
jgi:ABC-type dipeptide/oligopeptide/nickel transport system permease component